MKKYTIILFAILIFGCSERVDNFYPNYTQASIDGAFAKGWVPKEIPSSAASIKETHYIDSTTVWLTYSYLGEIPFTCTGKLIGINFDRIATTVEKGPGWWKDKIVKFKNATSSGHTTCYVCQYEDTYDAILLIDHSAHEVLYRRGSRT